MWSRQPKKNVLLSLDVFRGMTIAGMILVNNPGTWSAIYSPLKHAEWHGITPTDYIFPFFLFIVGMAIPLALGKRIENGTIIERCLSENFATFGNNFSARSFSCSISLFQFFQSKNSRQFCSESRFAI